MSLQHLLTLLLAASCLAAPEAEAEAAPEAAPGLGYRYGRGRGYPRPAYPAPRCQVRGGRGAPPPGHL